LLFAILHLLDEFLATGIGDGTPEELDRLGGFGFREIEIIIAVVVIGFAGREIPGPGERTFR
jgi:hypothetical protein